MYSSLRSEFPLGKYKVKSSICRRRHGNESSREWQCRRKLTGRKDADRCLVTLGNDNTVGPMDTSYFVYCGRDRIVRVVVSDWIKLMACCRRSLIFISGCFIILNGWTISTILTGPCSVMCFSFVGFGLQVKHHYHVLIDTMERSKVTVFSSIPSMKPKVSNMRHIPFMTHVFVSVKNTQTLAKCQPLNR